MARPAEAKQSAPGASPFYSDPASNRRTLASFAQATPKAPGSQASSTRRSMFAHPKRKSSDAHYGRNSPDAHNELKRGRVESVACELGTVRCSEWAQGQSSTPSQALYASTERARSSRSSASGAGFSDTMEDCISIDSNVALPIVAIAAEPVPDPPPAYMPVMPCFPRADAASILAKTPCPKMPGHLLQGLGVREQDLANNVMAHDVLSTVANTSGLNTAAACVFATHMVARLTMGGAPLVDSPEETCALLLGNPYFKANFLKECQLRIALDVMSVPPTDPEAGIKIRIAERKMKLLMAAMPSPAQLRDANRH